MYVNMTCLRACGHLPIAGVTIFLHAEPPCGPRGLSPAFESILLGAAGSL